MKKLNNKLKSNVEQATIRSQKDIINRLRLFDFAKSAISLYCEGRKANLEGYDFMDFKEKFKLVEFKESKEIEGITYKEIINVGNKFIEDELADSIFVLNISTFENWILTVLNNKMKDNKANIFNADDKTVNIAVIKESADIDELWEKIISQYLQKLPYSGIKSMLLKLLKDFNVKQHDITPNLLDRINENSLCRNILVHNQKKVNDDYIRKSGKFAVFTNGDIIKITETLLFNQGDNLLRFMQEFRKIITS